MNFLMAFSFSSFYFKRPQISYLVQTTILYMVFNVILLSLGFVIGRWIGGIFEELALRAGLSLFLIVGLKILIKGVRTRPMERIFDISKPMTYLGLLLVINIDVLLAGTSTALMEPALWRTLTLIFAGTGLAGFFIGGLTGKRASFLLSNKLELISALAIIGFCLYTFFKI